MPAFRLATPYAGEAVGGADALWVASTGPLERTSPGRARDLQTMYGIRGERCCPSSPSTTASSERDDQEYLLEEAAPAGWLRQAAGIDAADAGTPMAPAFGLLPTGHPVVRRTIAMYRELLERLLAFGPATPLRTPASVGYDDLRAVPREGRRRPEETDCQ